jgi:hypothetical protein
MTADKTKVKYEVTVKRVTICRVLVEVLEHDKAGAKNAALAHLDCRVTDSVKDTVLRCAISDSKAPPANHIPEVNSRESDSDVLYRVSDVAWDGEVPGPEQLRVWVPVELHVLRGTAAEEELEGFVSDAITGWQGDTHCGFSFDPEAT